MTSQSTGSAAAAAAAAAASFNVSDKNLRALQRARDPSVRRPPVISEERPSYTRASPRKYEMIKIKMFSRLLSMTDCSCHRKTERSRMASSFANQREAILFLRVHSFFSSSDLLLRSRKMSKHRHTDIGHIATTELAS